MITIKHDSDKRIVIFSETKPKAIFSKSYPLKINGEGWSIDTSYIALIIHILDELKKNL